MIDVFNDLRSPKSKVVETFPTIPSSYPPSCLNGYQVNSIKNPMLAETFPHEVELEVVKALLIFEKLLSLKLNKHSPVKKQTKKIKTVV